MKIRFLNENNVNFFHEICNFISHRSMMTILESLTLADLTSIYEKNCSMDKKKYRSISILPYEKFIKCMQFSEYMDKYLAKIIYGVRKLHSTEHALLQLL